MPDQVVTETDSQDVATTPQGTAAPANDPSANATGEGQQPTPQGFDEDFLKKLDALDPASLPQSFAEKYVPKAEFTKKTQALAEERKKFDVEKQAMFELARRAIQDKQSGPTGPTAEDIKRKELLDLATAGDGAAMQQLIQMEAERQVNPIRNQVALQSAAQAARAANPYVVEHWGEIIQTMQNDPVLQKLATMDNYAAADRVMIALGLEHQVKDLVPKYTEAQEKIKALETKLQGYERERTASLPSSTTRAGTTAGRPAAGEVNSIEDAGLKAWLELGYPREEYR